MFLVSAHAPPSKSVYLYYIRLVQRSAPILIHPTKRPRTPGPNSPNGYQERHVRLSCKSSRSPGLRLATQSLQMSNPKPEIHPTGLARSASQEIDTHRPPKRSRKAINCDPCRASKLKCDRGRPCSGCVLRGTTAQCYPDSAINGDHGPVTPAATSDVATDS